MYDRNVKSERVLTKLWVLDYEYICDRNAKFHQIKKLFITRVINDQILTTKYFSFQYSATYCSQALTRPAHRARETVHLLTHETPDFITPALWPANSPDLNPVDYQIWGSCGSVCTAARFVTSTSWSRACRSKFEEWEHFHQVVIDKAVRQWRPHLRAHGGHFEHRL